MKYDELKSKTKEKWNCFKENAKEKARDAYLWACEHREEATAIATVGVVAFRTLGKEVLRANRLRKEQDLKDLYVYDRSLGVYHELRRKLTPSEARELDRRRRDGESMTQILSSMRVLK